MEFSDNLMDLKLDIGMMIQKFQNGEEDDPELVIENLGKIQGAIQKIIGRLRG